jgi:hypothetical protein
MRRHIRRTALINKRRASGAEGGITLETALVMPVFLLLVFFLLFLVQTSIVSMAVHGALAQSVRMTASAWYPISLLAKEDGNSKTQSDLSSWNEHLSGARETIGEYGRWLPSPLKEWAEQISEWEWTPEGQAARMTFQQLSLRMANSRVIDPGRFQIAAVSLPEAGDPKQAFLTVEAEYRLPFRVPFAARSLVIRSSVRERAWVGGTPSKARLTDGQQNSLSISFVSLEPSPVRPGRKATLVLRTTPGTSIDLSVLYKSGRSQAKHLGIVVADAAGLVSWTWHVSGNTTPGEWNWEVTGAGGSWKQPFQVAGKRAESGDQR